MKILEYYYHDIDEDGWRFSKVVFGRLNLLVGDSATGKTRLLTTIFNLGRFVASNEYKQGHWDITFEHNNIQYKWMIESKADLSGSDEIGETYIKEQLRVIDEGEEKLLIDRNDSHFRFLDKDLPKLTSRETSLHLLKEEEAIKPIYDAFSIIKRRRFFDDELSKISNYQAVPLNLNGKLDKEKRLDILFKSDRNLNLNLYFLHKYFRKTFKILSEQYKAIFPFISKLSVRDLGELRPEIGTGGLLPVGAIQEKGKNKWLPINELSSGMQKVLLLLTDILILPDESVYLVDEYENSLGISAIEFLPSFINELEKNIQFFIASHHPYLINNVPVKDWYVFHREGSEVTIKFGDELVERYGKSKQQSFIQLINDPFFSEGVD